MLSSLSLDQTTEQLQPLQTLEMEVKLATWRWDGWSGLEFDPYPYPSLSIWLVVWNIFYFPIYWE